ncbi:MAG TPA: hypothetical protein VGB88_03490, partial [Alphaproteobacteria bacterium]
MDVSDITIYIAKTERNTFLAATNESPYFCVEADSEEELLRLAAYALRFYRNNKDTPSQRTSSSQTIEG